MKQFFILLGVVAMGATAYGQAGTDFVNIPDENFKYALIENTSINTDGDTEISYEEAREYTGNINVSNENISSLEGIEAFVNIIELNCSGNYSMQNIDLSKNTALQTLNCSGTKLTSLDLGKNTALRILDIRNTNITSLDLSKNTVLQTLNCRNTKLTSLDLSKNTLLQTLDCSENQLTSLDLSKNTLLQILDCSKNQLISINLSKNIALEELTCSSNKLRVLVVIKNTMLKKLYCSNNYQLTSLDVSKNTALQKLDCNNNGLKSLDVSNNTALQYLSCSNNYQLTSLDVSKNTALQYLWCSNNQLTNLDVSKNTALRELYCDNNRLTSLDVSKNTALRKLYCYDNGLTLLNLANGNNRNLGLLRTENNRSLRCIQIDKGFIPPYNSLDWYKDGYASYSDNCNYPTLSTTEVKAENAIQILNPVKDNLVIKTTAKIERVEIYNTAGQLVKVLFRGNTQVQDLAKGIYLLKITTDQGVITEKIIKQ